MVLASVGSVDLRGRAASRCAKNGIRDTFSLAFITQRAAAHHHPAQSPAKRGLPSQCADKGPGRPGLVFDGLHATHHADQPVRRIDERTGAMAGRAWRGAARGLSRAARTERRRTLRRLRRTQSRRNAALGGNLRVVSVHRQPELRHTARLFARARQRPDGTGSHKIQRPQLANHSLRSKRQDPKPDDSQATTAPSPPGSSLRCGRTPPCCSSPAWPTRPVHVPLSRGRFRRWACPTPASGQPVRRSVHTR